MLSRLTGIPVQDVSDQHFAVTALIQDEFNNLSEKFFGDVEKSMGSES